MNLGFESERLEFISHCYLLVCDLKQFTYYFQILVSTSLRWGIMFPSWSRHNLYEGRDNNLFSVLLTMVPPGLVTVISIILCSTIPTSLYFFKQVMIIHSLILYDLCCRHLYIAVCNFIKFLNYSISSFINRIKRIIELWEISRIICA